MGELCSSTFKHRRFILSSSITFHYKLCHPSSKNKPECSWTFPKLPCRNVHHYTHCRRRKASFSPFCNHNCLLHYLHATHHGRWRLILVGGSNKIGFSVIKQHVQTIIFQLCFLTSLVLHANTWNFHSFSSPLVSVTKRLNVVVHIL